MLPDLPLPVGRPGLGHSRGYLSRASHSQTSHSIDLHSLVFSSAIAMENILRSVRALSDKQK